MIAKSYIQENLKNLDVKFRKAQNSKDEHFFSKLAILELCGWIEESMDDMVRRCARHCIKDPDNMRYVESMVIKKTFAFDYEKFRFMMMRVVGLANVERIEKKVDAVIKTKFVAVLSTLKVARDSEAHTHIKGVARSINAPSVTRAQFLDVYNGLIEYDKIIKRTRV